MTTSFFSKNPFCDYFNLMTNKHQDWGQDVLDLFGQCLLGNANRGKLILENVTIEVKQSLPHQEANSQGLPSRGLLQVWHLFLSSLSNLALVLFPFTIFYIKMPALAQETHILGRDPGVFPWRGLSRRLDHGPPSLWGLGTPRRKYRFLLLFSYIAKNAYMAAICQVLGRC